MVANHIIFAEPNLNPHTRLQAEDRIWRLGQRKQCFVYRCVCFVQILYILYNTYITYYMHYFVNLLFSFFSGYIAKTRLKCVSNKSKIANWFYQKKFLKRKIDNCTHTHMISLYMDIIYNYDLNLTLIYFIGNPQLIQTNQLTVAVLYKIYVLYMYMHAYCIHKKYYYTDVCFRRETRVKFLSHKPW